MKVINYVCNKILNVLQNNYIICKEDEAFYRYGLEILLRDIMLDMIIILTGLITKMLPTTIVFLIVFSIIRKLTGGYHANKRWKCFCLTNILHLIVLTVVAHRASFNTIYVCLLCNIASVIIVWIKAPMVSVNCIKDEQQIKRIRLISRMLVVLIAMWQMLDLILFGKCSMIYFTMIITLLEVAVLLAIRKEAIK